MSKIEQTEETKQLIEMYNGQYLATIHELEERADEIIGNGEACDAEITVTIKIFPTDIVRYTILRERVAREIMQPKQDEQPKKHN